MPASTVTARPAPDLMLVHHLVIHSPPLSDTTANTCYNTRIFANRQFNDARFVGHRRHQRKFSQRSNSPQKGVAWRSRSPAASMPSLGPKTARGSCLMVAEE